MSAESLLSQLQNDQPDNPKVLYAIAQISLQKGDLKKALPDLQRSVTEMPEFCQPLLQLAQVYNKLDQFSDAQACYQSLVKRFPDWVIGLFDAAGFLQTAGQFDQAVKLLYQILAIDPSHVGSYLGLSGMIDMADEQKLIDSMQQLLSRLSIESSSRKLSSSQHVMRLSYALGKAMDDRKSFDEAFNYWRKANDLQLAHCSFRVKQMRPFFEEIKKQCDQLSANKRFEYKSQIQKNSAITPIFIVGLPRSGSTLLEQMLSAHSKIETVGEVSYFPEIIATEVAKITAKNYPLDLTVLTDDQYFDIGRLYLEKIQKHSVKINSVNPQYVIDKLPSNFQSIGLIVKALPQAKIIHIEREPMAVALSIFRNYFAANEPYFCNFEEFAEYHGLYADLMSYWKQSLSTAWFAIQYHGLVEQSEQSLTQILEYLQLPWEASCLNFQTKKVRIDTLSNAQVRQSIDTNKIDYWKNYRQQPEMKQFAEKIAR